MVKLILNRIFSRYRIFEEERIFDKNMHVFVHKYPYNKDKARYGFAKAFIKGDNVLDVACGGGHGSFIISCNSGSLVCGLDISKKAISFAKANFQNQNLRFCQGDVYKTGFADSSFSSIVSIETIEHLSDHDMFLSELKRVLKKDGVLVISSPEKIVKDIFFDNPHHINLLYKEETAALLKKYFHVTSIYCQTPFLRSPVPLVYLSLIFSSIFLSTKIVADKPYLSGTSCIFICRSKS